MAGSGRKNADGVFMTALAAGATVEQAALTAGIAVRTGFRRLADPGFRQRVAEARAAMMDRSLGMLANATCEAVASLQGLLSAESETARLGAAKAVLELAAKFRETVELEQRLQALEARSANEKNNAAQQLRSAPGGNYHALEFASQPSRSD